MKRVTFFSFLITFFSLSFFSCSNDNDDLSEQELITTLELTLTNGTEIIQLISKDLDGDGPNAPVVTISGNFTKNTTYSASIRFLNELENPVEDITEEILEEATSHQIFYQVTNGLGSFTYADFDSNGRPIGIQTNFQTTNAGNGNLRVTLRHKPNKNASGVAEGNIANAGGETDIEVNFNILVVE